MIKCSNFALLFCNFFFCFPMFRNTMPQSSSIGRHFFLNQTRIMLSFIGYLIGLFGKVQSISMADVGKVLIYWYSIPIFGGWPAWRWRSCMILLLYIEIIHSLFGDGTNGLELIYHTNFISANMTCFKLIFFYVNRYEISVIIKWV